MPFAVSFSTEGNTVICGCSFRAWDMFPKTTLAASARVYDTAYPIVGATAGTCPRPTGGGKCAKKPLTKGGIHGITLSTYLVSGFIGKET